jgi:death-on-curing protein
VIEIHDVLLEDHGGLPGIRDKGLLASAVEMPRQTMYGEYLHKTLFDKAAAYLFHIVNNHPFYDGNKRTGAFVTIFFLEENGEPFTIPDKLYEDFVVEVASKRVRKEQIADFLKTTIQV